ncbi:hypothetical protein OH705_26875, partial [Pseudomonas sp. BJa3]|nr:hypothetical protein [Pseudomonas sp. BJa3]
KSSRKTEEAFSFSQVNEEGCLRKIFRRDCEVFLSFQFHLRFKESKRKTKQYFFSNKGDLSKIAIS